MAADQRPDSSRGSRVPKLCVGQGVQAGNLGVPILPEELAKLAAASGATQPGGMTVMRTGRLDGTTVRHA